MTIAAQTSSDNRVSYTGNGVTTSFSFPKPFTAQADLVVQKVLVASPYTATTQVLNTDYTISGTADTQGRYGSGANVIMGSAPASTYNIVIYADPTISQGLDLVENDSLPAEQLELSFDKGTLIDRRTRDMIARTFRLPDSSVSTGTTTLEPVASSLVGFDASKNLTTYDPSSAVTVASNVTVTQAGTGAGSRTAQAKMRDTLCVLDFYADGVGTSTTMVDPTGVTDSYLGIQAAINQAYSSGKQFVYVPAGTYKITKPLYLWGAAHYWTTDNGVTLVGDGRNSTIIQKTTTSTTGDGSAYGTTDAIVIFTPHSKLTADTAFNCGLRELQLASTATGLHGAIALGPLARLDVDGVAIVGVQRGLSAADTMYLSNLRRLVISASHYGIKMDTTGTANHLDGCFVYATDAVAYLLRGSYSTGTALAADNNTGVCYQFAGADWVINGLGSESTSATKVIDLASGTTNRIIVNSPYIQPQNNVAKTVFSVATAGYLKLSGGSVGSNSSPVALAGQLYAAPTGVTVSPIQGIVFDRVDILDTYAVASTGVSTQGAGTVKNGKKSVADSTATTLYTLLNEEVGLFYAWGTANNGAVKALAMVAIAGGNPGLTSLNATSLTLSLSGSNVQVTHTLGAPYTVGWAFLRFGDALPFTW